MTKEMDNLLHAMVAVRGAIDLLKDGKHHEQFEKALKVYSELGAELIVLDETGLIALGWATWDYGKTTNGSNLLYDPEDDVHNVVTGLASIKRAADYLNDGKHAEILDTIFEVSDALFKELCSFNMKLAKSYYNWSFNTSLAI